MLVKYWTETGEERDNKSIFVGPDTLVKAIVDGKEIYSRVQAVDNWFGTEYFQLYNGIWVDEDSIVDSYA